MKTKIFWLLTLLFGYFAFAPSLAILSARAAQSTLIACVRDTSNQPINHILVMTSAAGNLYRDFTGANGCVNLSVPPGTNYHVQAWDWPDNKYAIAHYWGQTFNDGATHTLNFVLKTGGGKITGYIRDGLGSSIPNATVYAWELTGLGAGGTDNGAFGLATTDGNGYYQIAPDGGLPTGQFRVRVSADGHPGAEKENVAGTAGQETKVDFTLGNNGKATISGCVRDAADKLLSGIEVVAQASGPFFSGLTGANGCYQLFADPGSSYHFQASDNPNYRFATSHFWNQVLEDGKVYTIDFTLHSGGGVITGHIYDTQGQSIAGATVNAWEATAIGSMGYDNGAWGTAKSDSQGAYTIAPPGGLSSGKYYLQATAPGYPIGERGGVAVAAGATTEKVDLILLTGSGSISGRITDQAGNGIAGLRTVLANSSVASAVADTDKDGYYKLLYLPPAYYHVVVNYEGFANAHRYSVPVAENADTSNINFVLSTQMGEVRGHIIDIDGKPLPGVRVVADTNSGSGFSNTLTDGNGDYALSRLAPMRYWVRAEFDDHAPIRQQIDVYDAQNTTSVDFTMVKASGEINGTIRKDGQPAPGAEIFMNSSEGSAQNFFQFAVADSNGNYRLPNLPPGQYDVHVLSFTGYTNQIRYFVAVNTGATSGVDFNLTNGTSTFFGRVTDQAGKPLPGVIVRPFMTNNPGTWAITATDQNGEYRVSGLWPDKYKIYADMYGYPRVVKSFIPIASGEEIQVDFVLGVKGRLEVDPTEVSLVVITTFGTWTAVHTEVTAGDGVPWTARVDDPTAQWLRLGSSGASQEVSGKSGQDLIVRVEPAGVDFGKHTTTVTLTSSVVDPATIQVIMTKYEKWPASVYLPQISH